MCGSRGCHACVQCYGKQHNVDTLGWPVRMQQAWHVNHTYATWRGDFLEAFHMREEIQLRAITLIVLGLGQGGMYVQDVLGYYLPSGC